MPQATVCLAVTNCLALVSPLYNLFHSDTDEERATNESVVTSTNKVDTSLNTGVTSISGRIQDPDSNGGTTVTFTTLGTGIVSSNQTDDTQIVRFQDPDSNGGTTVTFTTLGTETS
jgi:hypothetical protein